MLGELLATTREELRVMEEQLGMSEHVIAEQVRELQQVNAQLFAAACPTPAHGFAPAFSDLPLPPSTELHRQAARFRAQAVQARAQAGPLRARSAQLREYSLTLFTSARGRRAQLKYLPKPSTDKKP